MSKLLRNMLTAYTERDWKQFHSSKSLGVEEAQIMEHFRRVKEEEIYLKDPKKLQAVKHEIGDVLMAHTLSAIPIQASAENL